MSKTWRECWECSRRYHVRSYGWLIRHMLVKHGYKLTEHGGIYHD